MLDIIIRGGTIYDGTGKEKHVRIADVGIADGRIEAIGDLSETEAKQIIDASGQIVTPGFFDPHGHSDTSLLINPEAESMVHQGITTQISGQCGSSAAPAVEEEKLQQMEDVGQDISWSTMGQYREVLAKRGIAINAGTLVGHGSVRAMAVGYDAVAPNPEQKKKMVDLVAQAMDEGALGFSSGFQYAPGKYADEKEVIPLVKEVAKRGGIYTTHMRSEGTYLFEAIEESLMVARETDVPLEISHLKSSGKPNWGKIDRAIRIIEHAEKEGLKVAFDRYPYLAGSTSLTIYFQPWTLDGGRDKMLERLKDPDMRKQIKREMTESVEKALGWDRILVSDIGGKDKSNFPGKNIQQIADELGENPADTALMMLEKGNGYVGICTFSMDQKDTDKVLSHRLCSICTDATNRAPHGPLAESCPHPRAYGTFPRFISDYVRDKKIVPLHEAVRRMCHLPAQMHGIKQRGLLQEGYWGDVVVFDYDRIEDRSQYGDPHHFPVGVDYVLVNGQVVIKNGEHTGALPGQVL